MRLEYLSRLGGCAVMTCPSCWIEWNGWQLGVACPDCGGPGRDLDWRDYLWTESAASTAPRDHSKWGL